MSSEHVGEQRIARAQDVVELVLVQEGEQHRRLLLVEEGQEVPPTVQLVHHPSKIKKIGPTIENHKLFPKKCNVTLAKVINNKLVKVRVWERGAGLTKACGTAACATAVSGYINELIEKRVDIEFSLGKLSISIDENNSVHMKGPVSDIVNIDIKL